MKSSHAIVLALSIACLGACGGTGTGPSEAKPVLRPSGTSLLQQVRSAGQMGNELDVQPLRDPRVEDLRASATQAEARGDFAAAEKLLERAAKYTPDDPDLLQWQAELALLVKDWPRVERLATRSYQVGPKLGGLCRRNWTALHLVAESRADAAAAQHAQAQTVACTVAPPTRM